MLKTPEAYIKRAAAPLSARAVTAARRCGRIPAGNPHRRARRRGRAAARRGCGGRGGTEVEQAQDRACHVGRRQHAIAVAFPLQRLGCRTRLRPRWRTDDPQRSGKRQHERNDDGDEPDHSCLRAGPRRRRPARWATCRPASPPCPPQSICACSPRRPCSGRSSPRRSPRSTP